MKTEKTFIGIFLLALILKFNNIPGSSVLLILSLGVISILYLPLAFYFFSDKSLKNQNIVLSITGGMALALMPIGILFKFMYWPGAQVSLIGSIFFTSILLIIVFILNRQNSEQLKTYYKNYFIRIIFWLSLGLILCFTSKRTLIEFQHSDDPEMARLQIQSFENPSNEDYYNELQNYYHKNDSLYLVKHRDE